MVNRSTDDSSPGAPLYTIVGVVKDFRTVVATGEVEPIVFHPFSYFQKFGATDDYMLDYSMMIRLRGMSPESLEAVQRKIGEYPSGNNHTLEVYDNKLGPILFEIRSFRNIVFTVSGITLLIALMVEVGQQAQVGGELHAALANAGQCIQDEGVHLAAVGIVGEKAEFSILHPL